MYKWFVSSMMCCEVVLLICLISNQFAHWSLYLLSHLAVSIAVALPWHEKPRSAHDMSSIFLLVFCLPVFGMFQFLMVLIRNFHSKPDDNQQYAHNICELEEPDSSLMKPGGADAIQLLQGLSHEAYLELLLSARSLPRHQSLKLWSEAMNSVDENARLVGYCFANELEETFQKRLQKVLAELERSDPEKEKSHKHLLVADLYWQHFRLGQLKSEDHATALKKVVTHAMQSIRANSEVSQTYALLGEVMQFSQRPQEARYFFRKANYLRGSKVTPAVNDNFALPEHNLVMISSAA